MKKFYKTAGMVAGGILAFATFQCQSINDTQAYIVDKDGVKWWDLYEMPEIYEEEEAAFNSLSEEELAKLNEPMEGCEGEEMFRNWVCMTTGKQRFLQLNKEKGWYAASEFITNWGIPMTIYPKEEKILFRSNALISKDNPVAIESISITWRDDASKIGKTLFDKKGNLLDDVHQVKWKSVDPEVDGRAQEIMISNITGLSENKTGYLLAGNNSHAQSRTGEINISSGSIGVYYKDCIENEDYVEGMECRRLMNADHDSKYFPMWEKDEWKNTVKGDEDEPGESGVSSDDGLVGDENSGGEANEPDTTEDSLDDAITDGDSKEGASESEWVATEPVALISVSTKKTMSDVECTDSVALAADLEEANSAAKVKEVSEDEDKGLTEVEPLAQKTEVEVPELNGGEVGCLNESVIWKSIALLGAALGMIWLIILLFKRKKNDEEDDDTES